MRRYVLLGLFLAGYFMAGPDVIAQKINSEAPVSKKKPNPDESIAAKWGKIALEATGRDTERFNPRPTVTSRYLGLVFTAIFDAWSRYDDKATPVYLKEVKRAEKGKRTSSNKETAVSYAAYGALREYFFSDSIYLKKMMTDFGYDPENRSLNPETPEGIGNLAAMAVIQARKNDGSNQYGEENGSDGKPYFNYVGYLPVNSVETNTDPNRWQPKYFSNGKGGRFAPPCLTPFWNKVKPVGLKSPSQFRPGPPPLVGSDQLKIEIQQVVELQAALTDEQKGLVEFMRDGPKSVQQAGHWLSFALDVSKRDHNTLDEDIKMLFLNQVTAMDAFIACWDTKMFYDFARPYALVHDYYQDKTIKAWGGPDKGMISINGKEWRPYSPETFLCPPFPGYVSGHSSISGACAEVLRLFTGSDVFGRKVEVMAGSMTEPENLSKKVIIDFPTFTETADKAGFSRVLGGYHIQSDNIAGLELGRNVAHEVWKFYQMHLGK